MMKGPKFEEVESDEEETYSAPPERAVIEEPDGRCA